MSRRLVGGMELFEPPVHEYNQWRYDQIYFGPDKYTSIFKGGVVPNIDDTVIQFSGGGKYLLYRVISKDPITLIPQLSLLTPSASPDESEELGNELLFAGLGVGRVNDTSRLFVNYDNLRYPAVVDARLRAYGSNTSYYKIFLGVDITETGKVVSVRYNANGDVLGDMIPFEVVDNTDPNKLGFKPLPCNVNRALKEGELLTLVAYDDTNGVVCYQPLIVVHSAAVQNVNPYTNYVVGIHLESPYLSATNNHLLEIPENFLNTSLIKEAYVDYKDGSKRKVLLGQQGMTLHGWEGHSGQWAGQNFNLVLTYQLAENEVAPTAEIGEGNMPHIFADYKVTTKPADPATSVKIYACPVWVSGIQGYSLRYWLYNLQQTSYVEVTDKIRIGSGGTGAFKPKAYGDLQTMVVTLQLNEVNGTYPNIQYVQEFDITLMGAPSLDTTAFYLWYTRGSSRPYGEGLQVEVKQHESKPALDISCGLTQPFDWLDKLYYRLEPQFDATTTDKAVEPSLVEIVCKNGSIEVAVDMWDNMIPINFTAPTSGETIYFNWKYQDAGGNKKHLATSTMYAFVG